jgi:hypothetical protein
MPWYGFIHPALAVGTLAYGLVTGQTSLSRINDWNFPLRRQRYRSVVFFLMCVGNFIIGLLATALIRGRGGTVKLTAHTLLAAIVLAFALLAALVPFARSRPGEISGLMRLHPVLIIVCLAVIFTMGFIALLAVFHV